MQRSFDFDYLAQLFPKKREFGLSWAKKIAVKKIGKKVLVKKSKNEAFIREAIRLARQNVKSGRGGPFGCVVVHKGSIIAKGQNSVTRTNDPSAHAEIVAIRKACKKLKSFQLKNCIVVSSCEPCPMCLGAIYWARPRALVFASSKKDAAEVGFDDDYIYEELRKKYSDRKLKTIQEIHPTHLIPFQEWKSNHHKIRY